MYCCEFLIYSFKQTKVVKKSLCTDNPKKTVPSTRTTLHYIIMIITIVSLL